MGNTVEDRTDPLISTGVAAKLVGCSASYLRRLDAILRPIRIGTHRRYRRSAVTLYSANRHAAIAARAGLLH